MSDKTELLPCPFCGQQDAFVEQLDSDASVVICQGRIDEHSACLARGPVAVQESEDEDQPGFDAAIREWNNRAALAQQPAPVAMPADPVLRARVADLLHLLQFSKIETPSAGDAAQTEIAMNDLERMLAAEQPHAVVVLVETLRRIHRDLDSCQKVIWLAGCRPRGYGFDPTYVADAQARLKEIDAMLAGGDA